MNFISNIIKIFNMMRERLKNEITDIKNTIAEAKKMFMGGFPKPPAMNFPVPQNKP